MPLFTPEECDQLISGEKYKKARPDHRVKSGASLPVNISEFHESLHGLAPREAEVLTRLMVDDISQKELAADIGLSFNTINAYKMSGMRKLGITSDVGLVKFFIRNGILHL